MYLNYITFNNKIGNRRLRNKFSLKIKNQNISILSVQLVKPEVVRVFLEDFDDSLSNNINSIKGDLSVEINNLRDIDGRLIYVQ